MSAVTDFIAQIQGARVSPNIEPMRGDVDNLTLALQQLEAGTTPTGPAGGDLVGNYPNPSVAKIQTIPVANTAPIDGQILTFNSTANQYQPRTPANSHPGFVANRWYSTLQTESANPALFTVATNALYVCPIFLPSATTLKGLAAQNTLGSAGNSFRLGIYNNSGGVPTTLILDAGLVSIAIAQFQSIVINQTLNQGWYWLALASTIGVNVESFLAENMAPYFGNTNSFATIAASLTGAGTFAAGGLPANFPAITYGTDNTPIIGFTV